MFSDDEVRSLHDELPPDDSTYTERLDAIRAIMTRAVELAAARGGTMTADAVRSDLNVMHSAATSTEACNAARARLEDHISAIGARNAVLEDVLTQALTVKDGLFDEVKSVTKDRDWWRACSEIERKRGDAAEERCAAWKKAPTHPTEVARREGFNEGAEAMGAACWEAVQAALQRHGWAHADGTWQDVKAAIEGAAP